MIEAAESKLRAERKAGEALRDMKKNPGGQPEQRKTRINCPVGETMSS
jgi:hypothetical protein